MDPDSCLLRAEKAQQEGDLDTCREACESYREWRRNGGFAAEDGDYRVRACERWISRQLNKVVN